MNRDLNRVWLTFVLMGACMLWSACRQSIDPSSAPSYFLSPDTLRANVLDQNTFSLRSSDSNWRAFKYLWDFGDGGQPVSVLNSNQVSHTYSSKGTYHISGTAMDSLGDDLVSVHSLAIIGLPNVVVAIHSRDITDTTILPVLFQVKVNSSLPLQYFWNFGDGSSLVSSTSDTVSHLYNSEGSYCLTVTAIYSGQVISSDTSRVSIHFPQTSCAQLCGMFSISSSVVSNNKELLGITIPITNAGDTSFSVHGFSFDAEYTHQRELDSNENTFDSVSSRSISGTLSSNGQYLLLTNSVIFDSDYYTSPDQGAKDLTWEASTFSYPVDSLRLVSISLDSIVFQACHNIQTDLYHTYIRYNGLCGFYVPSLSGPNLTPEPYGIVRIVFRRNS
jgi:PKD repeat protein